MTFTPNRKLAFRVVRNSVLRGSWNLRLCLLGTSSALAVNGIRYFLDAPVTSLQWIGSALFGPFILLLGLLEQYFTYRFATHLTLDDRGLHRGRWGHIYGKPDTCTVAKLEEKPLCYYLTISGRAVLTKARITLYSGLTQDFDSATNFQNEFNLRFNKPS